MRADASRFGIPIHCAILVDNWWEDSFYMADAKCKFNERTSGSQTGCQQRASVDSIHIAVLDALSCFGSF